MIAAFFFGDTYLLFLSKKTLYAGKVAVAIPRCWPRIYGFGDDVTLLLVNYEAVLTAR